MNKRHKILFILQASVTCHLSLVTCHLSLGMIPVTLGIIASVTMPGLTDPETVIPQMALTHLHPVAIAVFVGALLAQS